jgi:transcriptional regulator with XRE-family HTH domain
LRAGEQLKELRGRVGITTREVEELSRKLADSENNSEFYISNAWLTQLENTQSSPSIYKLYSLSVIYRIKFNELLHIFGIDLDRIAKYQSELLLAATHITNLSVYDSERRVSFPVKFDSGFTAEKTGLLSRMVEVWGEVPIALVQHLDVRNSQYGYIGLEDYTMYPLLRPGSFVQIDSKANRVHTSEWRTEFDRAIYFIELHDGYACSWCELQGARLTLLPHPLSPCSTRQYEYPSEAEIIGQVTAVAMRLVGAHESSAIAPKLPRRT